MDTLANRIRWTIVKAKNRFGRGQHWISYFNPIIYISGLAYLKTLSEHPGIVPWLAVGYVLFCVSAGWADETFGIWKLEAIWGAKDMNPFFEQHDEEQKDINKKLDLLLSRPE